MDIRMSSIASPMPQIRAKFTNKLGIPLSGCKVYTYEPNSDIPKTTWLDIDKTTENTNPILLDAAGEADIFLNGLYRVVVKDRFGFVVYDVEKTGIELSASFVVSADGSTQQDINDFGGAKWRNKAGGYALGATVKLDDGDIVKSTISGNTNDPNADMTGWDFDDDSVSNINKLRLKSAKKGKKIYLISVNEGQGEGGGEFILTQKTGLVDDGGTIIQSPTPNLFYVRMNYDVVTPEMFGAKGNDIAFDDSAAIQTAFLHSKPCLLAAKKYYTQKPVHYQTNKVIKGCGELDTQILKVNNSTLSFGDRTINGKVMNFDKDCVLLAYPRSSDWYSQNNELSMFSFGYASSVVVKGNSWYAPLICQTSHRNLKVLNGTVGIKTVDCWMVTWDRVEASADAPWIMGAQDTAWKGNGTSNTFNSCWATTARGSNYAWNFYSMQYSTMQSCGTDYTGLDGQPALGVYRFVNCTISLNNCGCERIHAYNFAHVQSSYIQMNGGSYQDIHNKYKLSSPTWATSNNAIRVLTNARLEMKAVEFSILYNSLNNANCTGFAFVDDNSQLTWDSQCTQSVQIEEISTSGSYNPTKFGLYYVGNSQVNFETVTDCYNVSTGSTWGRANVLLNPTHSFTTSRNINTTGYVKSAPRNLGTENLNDLRTLGCCTFVQGTASNATLANNYPQSGGGWFIEQISQGTSGNNTNTIQKAYRFDTANPIFLIRSVAWGSPTWSPWKTITSA